MTQAEGIIAPPIDELLEKVGSNYELVIFASKRARQINELYEEESDELLFDKNDFAQFRWLNKKEKNLFSCHDVDCENKAVKEYSFDDSTFYYCKEH